MYTEDQLSPYYEFLNECRKKDYTNSAIHRHHIIPRFMGGSDNSENLIELSPEDHYNAHIKLANCFKSGQEEYYKNIGAARQVLNNARRYLKKWHSGQIPDDVIIFWELANTLLLGLNSGENNPMFGKTHSFEIREKIKTNQKNLRRGKDHHNYGRPIVEMTEERRRIISEQHKGKKVSAETRHKIALSKVKPKYLENGVFYYFDLFDYNYNKNFLRICICGKYLYYTSLSYANAAELKKTQCNSCNKIGKPSPIRGKIIGNRKYKCKQVNRQYIGSENPNAKIVVLENGIIYGSITDACKEMNITRVGLTKMEIDGAIKIVKRSMYGKS